jgi:hypothetical protein
VLWSPRKFREASERQQQREQAEEQEKLQKSNMKELKANNALYKKRIAEEKRVERGRLKKEREKEKEKKVQEQAQKKQQKDKEKPAANPLNSVQQPQIGKRVVSNKPPLKNKRVKRCIGGASGGQSEESSQAPPPKTTSRGRNITLLSKFR